MSSNDQDRDFEVSKMQLDYAWKWFSYHADQRMKAFNFMLLTFGILTTAIVTSIDKRTEIAGYLCLTSVVLAFLFFLLDLRNDKLVEIGRKELRRLERYVVYVKFYNDNGVVLSEEDKTRLGILLPLKFADDRSKSLATFSDLISVVSKHRWVIRLVALLFVLIFLLAFFNMQSQPRLPFTKVEITLPKI